MTTQENRLLVRNGARELTFEEIDRVSAAGGPFQTQVCSIPFATATHTGPGDGDACGDMDSDASMV